MSFKFIWVLLIFYSVLQEAQVYARENGLFFMETSAKTAANVNDIFYEIGNFLFRKNQSCHFSSWGLATLKICCSSCGGQAQDLLLT